MATATSRDAPASARAGARVGALGIPLVLVGVALVAAAFVGLHWYSVSGGADVAGEGFTFGDLRQNADALTAPVASTYFDWLGWALLIAVGVTGILGNVPSPASGVLRVVGFLAGTAGVVGTYYAVAQLVYAQRAAGGTARGVWHSSSFGLWCALAGFLLAAVGAGLGPRRDRLGAAGPRRA